MFAVVATIPARRVANTAGARVQVRDERRGGGDGSAEGQAGEHTGDEQAGE